MRSAFLTLACAATIAMSLAADCWLAQAGKSGVERLS
jgi:hypothetical protein